MLSLKTFSVEKIDKEQNANDFLIFFLKENSARSGV